MVLGLSHCLDYGATETRSPTYRLSSRPLTRRPTRPGSTGRHSTTLATVGDQSNRSLSSTPSLSRRCRSSRPRVAVSIYFCRYYLFDLCLAPAALLIRLIVRGGVRTAHASVEWTVLRCVRPTNDLSPTAMLRRGYVAQCARRMLSNASFCSKTTRFFDKAFFQERVSKSSSWWKGDLRSLYPLHTSSWISGCGLWLVSSFLVQ